MATVDFNKYLGKRVRFYVDVLGVPDTPAIKHEGVVIATFKSAKGYEDIVGNDFLFLPDGGTHDDAEFFSGEYELELLS